MKLSFAKSGIEAVIVKIEDRTLKAPFTNTYGLARSVLALGTLMTLVFNDTDILFSNFYIGLDYGSFFKHINLFFLFKSNLQSGRVIAIIILALTISGYFPKITGILHWWVSLSFLCSATIIDGGDQITAILALLLIPITLMDQRTNHWNKQQFNYGYYKNFLATIFILLIQIQVSILYFSSGFAKFNVYEWLNGTAMYYWLTNNTFGAPAYLQSIVKPLCNSSFFVTLMTWGVILFEILLGCSIFFRRKVKIRMAYLGILFHFGIFLFLGLGSFFFAMAGALILYLLPFENELKRPFKKTS